MTRTIAAAVALLCLFSSPAFAGAGYGCGGGGCANAPHNGPGYAPPSERNHWNVPYTPQSPSGNVAQNSTGGNGVNYPGSDRAGGK